MNPHDAPISNPVFILKNLSFYASTYEWYYNNLLFSTNKDEHQSFALSGDYCFTLVAITDAGCKDTVTHCGSIYEKELVFFPNAFSPNGDNLNDGFGPVFYNVVFDNMKDYTFAIYNRWGQLVFETDNPQARWNGLTKNNGMMEAGVYYYYCKFTTPHGDVYDKKGDITLIR